MIPAISNVLPRYSQTLGTEVMELYYEEAWARESGWHISSIPMSITSGAATVALYAMENVSANAFGFAAYMAGIVISLSVGSWIKNASKDRAFSKASGSGIYPEAFLVCLLAWGILGRLEVVAVIS